MTESHLVIDTDIGTDVDDALALLQIIGSRGKTNTSVITSYGDVKLRARIAKSYMNLAKVDFPIALGESHPLSGKEIWISKMEGSLHSNLEDLDLSSIKWIEHIFSLTAYPDLEIEILAISPLTTIATALSKFPELAKRIKHIYIMGGRFGEGKAEHNIKSDVKAAQIVFASSIPISIIGIEQTSNLQINRAAFANISDKTASMKKLYEEIFQWTDFWNRDWIVPHDSLAYLMKQTPELFEFSENGVISVNEEGDTVFTGDPSGIHRYVTEVNIQDAFGAILEGIKGV